MRDNPSVRRVGVLLLASVALACGSEAGPPEVVTAVITAVQSEGADISGFTLAAEDGSYQITVEPGRDYGFALGHLHEHHATGAPVRVTLRSTWGVLHATSILDA
jgi:hypothetical protein